MFTARRALALALLLAAPVAAACGGGGEGNPEPSEPAAAPPADGAELRKLETEANRILDGGVDAFKARLAALRGHPIVVNQWASWCPPCREEFPFFQSLAEKYRGKVAFIGVDSADNREDAREFLEKFPTPYPHYWDPDLEVARVFKGGQAFPTTAFYDASGELTQTHAGAYATEAKLDEDIRRFALGG